MMPESRITMRKSRFYLRMIHMIRMIRTEQFADAQNAKEHVFVVCEVSHTLGDINVCMLRPLARCVFRPSPHDNLAHFVQNTVGIFKVPAFRPANSVRQMRLEQFKQRHSLPVQFLQVTYRHVPLPAQHIPFQSFDKYLCDLVAWVNDQRHIEQEERFVPGRSADLLVQVIGVSAEVIARCLG